MHPLPKRKVKRPNPPSVSTMSLPKRSPMAADRQWDHSNRRLDEPIPLNWDETKARKPLRISN